MEVPGEFLVDSRTAFKALREIKTRKPSFPDCIPSKVLKLFAFELAPVITDLYNTSLVQGVVPSQFKSSLVVPISKTTPPKTVEEDLRPITLTSQLAKIMEGFTLNLLYKQVVDQLDNKQFAVCGKSTTHALVYLVHCILEYLDKGVCYVRLFLADFSKGFDLVDHTVLMLELRSLGVHDAIIEWIADILSHRSQRLKIGDAISPCVFPNGGIPQGTKLAPILFAVLVNKLVAGWYTRVKYVDDLSVLECIPRCSPSYMPCITNEIAQYASDHGMRLNAKKCKEIIFSFLQYQPFPAIPLCLSGRVIERVGHYKLLGVFISSDLSWNKHCEYVLAKANKRLYALRVLRKCGVACQDLVQVAWLDQLLNMQHPSGQTFRFI